MLFLVTYPAQLLALALGLALIGPLTRRRPVALWTRLLLAAGVAAMAGLTLYVSDPPSLFHDFAIAYWPAGRAALSDPAALAALTEKGVNGFVNLPALALLFAPLGWLPLALAGPVFALIGLAAAAGAWALLCRAARLETADRWRLALIFAANGPLAYSLKEGNASHFVLLAIAAGLLLLRRGRRIAAGAALGAAALVKPPLVLFGGFLLLRRDRRGLAGFAAIGAAAGALSLAIYGWSANLRWFEACILGFGGHWLGAFNVQSFPALLLRLGASGRILFSWDPVAPSPALALAARLWLLLLFAAAIAAWLASLRAGGELRGAAQRRDWRLVLVLALALTASPLTWSHYYCWLLVAAAVFLGERRAWGPGERTLGWTALALASPIARVLPITEGPALAIYKDLAVSNFLLGALGWFALAAWRVSRPEPQVQAQAPAPQGGQQMTWRAVGPTGTLGRTALPQGEPPLRS